MSIRASHTEIAGRLAFGDQVELFHPTSIQELAEFLAEATAKKRRVLVWGGGTHQGIGHLIDPDVVVFTNRLNRLIAWEPDDLTVVVEAGVEIADLEAELATRGQTAILPEGSGSGTVGGSLATGTSSYRRARYGPTRDRVLEVQVVTGDGRIVRGGGRVVKNVTGYDLPRAVVGSLGALGVIVSCCFKLWPAPPTTATVTLPSLDNKLLDVHRPLAVLSNRLETKVYLGGTEAEVRNQVGRLGGEAVAGWSWPELPLMEWEFSLRLRTTDVARHLTLLPPSAEYVHQVEVGEVAIAAPSLEGIAELRASAEAAGGALVVARRGDSDFDPWGKPPETLELQRRLIAAFDPGRIVNPGRLPGRI